MTKIITHGALTVETVIHARAFIRGQSIFHSIKFYYETRLSRLMRSLGHAVPNDDNSIKNWHMNC